MIPFDRAFSRIPSESFVKDYLIGKVGVKNLVVGFNHRFGHDKEEITGCSTDCMTSSASV